MLCVFNKTGLSGVLFVLPDSYVDAENNEYGGKLIAHLSYIFLVRLNVVHFMLAVNINVHPNARR